MLLEKPVPGACPDKYARADSSSVNRAGITVIDMNSKLRQAWEASSVKTAPTLS
jgi:hypothetical protein